MNSYGSLLMITVLLRAASMGNLNEDARHSPTNTTLVALMPVLNKKAKGCKWTDKRSAKDRRSELYHDSMTLILEGFQERTIHPRVLKNAEGIPMKTLMALCTIPADGLERSRICGTVGRSCSWNMSTGDQLDYVPEEPKDAKPLRTVYQVRQLRDEAVQTGRWPGCEENENFLDRDGRFVPKIFWDDQNDVCLDQPRRAAAERALGIKMNRNAFWQFDENFDVYQQASSILNIFAIYL